MSGLDIWGAIVPAWLGGVGGMAAAAVSTIALIKSLKTQGGVETLKSAANAVGGTAAQLTATNTLSVPSPSSGSATEPMPPPLQSPVSWTAWHEARGRYRLRNDSTHTGAAARLTGFRDVTPGGDGSARYHGELPVELAANESVPLTIDKSLVSPSVTAIELTWADQDGSERKRTLYI